MTDVEKTSTGWLVAVLVVLVPLAGVFLPIPGTDVWYVQYIAMFSVFMLAMSVYLWNFSKLFALLSFLGLVSAVCIANQNPRAIICLIQLNFALLTIKFIAGLGQKSRILVLKSVLVLFVLQVVMLCLQGYNLDPVFDNIKNRAIDDTVGLSGSHNQAALFFAATAPLMASINPFLVLINTAALFLTTTTAAWAGFIVGIFVYFYLYLSKIIIFLIPVMIIMSVIFLRTDDLDSAKIWERKILIKNSIRDVERGFATMHSQDETRIVRCNRWFGFGLGNFIRISPLTQIEYMSAHRSVIEPMTGHVYEHVHNDVVEVWYELGRLGLFTVLALIGNFFFSFLINHKTKILTVCFCGILAQLICSLGIYTVQTVVSGMLLVIFYGVYLGEVRDGTVTSKRKGETTGLRDMRVLVPRA